MVLSMVCTAPRCAHCGTRGLALRRCARCKEVSYCGAACQKAGWKAHKNACEPPPTPAQLEHLKEFLQKQQHGEMEQRLRDMELSSAAGAGSSCARVSAKETESVRRMPIEEVDARLGAAAQSSDWQAILKFEGRIEELLEGGSDDARRNIILQAFIMAHRRGMAAAGGTDHARSVATLESRRVELLGRMERFRDQGLAMCNMGDHLLFIPDRRQDAARVFQQARSMALFGKY